MEYGWAESAPRLRSRLPNLNLLPAELLPTPLPWLTAGLALFAVGLLMLLYALFYMKSYTDLELQALRERLAQDQEVARQLGLPAEALAPGATALPPGTLEDWAELRARQVDWAAVFATLAAGLGPNLQVTGLSQAGYTVSVSGEAATAAEANTFLQRLRDSGLFASLEMSITGLEGPGAGVLPTAGPGTAPTPVATAAVQPTPPLAPQAAPPTPAPKPATSVQPPVSAPVVAPPAAAPPPAPAKPPAQPPAQPNPTLAPRTPLASPTPVGSPAAPAAAGTPLPQTDWVVQAKRETVFPDRTAPFSKIRVRAVDADGTLVPGLRVRVESEGSPAWSDELPHADHPASDGTFELGVGMGKFTVFMLNGSSEHATGLFTGVANQPGVHEWDVTFRKQAPGTPPAGPTCPGCTPTPTPTPTLTVAPTATPIAVGRNLASLACVSASHNGADARKAVDGDVGTAWDSGSGPVVNITFDFRYPTNCDTTRPKPVDQRTVQVEALELVTSMSARSKQTHEVWTVYDTGSAQLEYTFADVDVADNATISARFAAARNIQVLQIRTIRSGVNVGWREVRLFEPLAPPFGSVPTATPTGSPTPTPTAPASPLAFSSAQASSENPGNPAVLAIDGAPSTFWRPVTNPPPTQYLQLNFAVPQTVQTVRFQTAMGEAIATATATPNASTPTATPAGTSFRVSLLRPATAQEQRTAQDNDCYTQFVSADSATVQVSCSQPFSGVTGVRIYLDSIGNPAVPPGIREVSAYPPAQTPTPTPTFTPTGTPTGTSIPVATSTPTPSPTNTATPTNTPTPTRTPTPLEAATNFNDVSASDSELANPPALAVDGANGSQNPNTWWQTSNGVGIGAGQSAWWEINFLQPINVTRVETKLFMSRTATGTLTFQLFNQSGGVSRSDAVVSNAALSNQDTLPEPYATPVAGVDRIRITFSNLDQTGPGGPVVGLRTVYVFYTPSTSALAAFLSPLDRLVNFLAIRPAYAAPLEQTLPPAQVKPGAPAQPTPVVIGAPQQPSAQLPPNPVPSQPLPAGRVSFLIVAQVRPGAP